MTPASPGAPPSSPMSDSDSFEIPTAVPTVTAMEDAYVQWRREQHGNREMAPSPVLEYVRANIHTALDLLKMINSTLLNNMVNESIEFHAQTVISVQPDSFVERSAHVAADAREIARYMETLRAAAPQRAPQRAPNPKTQRTAQRATRKRLPAAAAATAGSSGATTRRVVPLTWTLTAVVEAARSTDKSMPVDVATSIAAAVLSSMRTIAKKTADQVDYASTDFTKPAKATALMAMPGEVRPRSALGMCVVATVDPVNPGGHIVEEHPLELDIDQKDGPRFLPRMPHLRDFITEGVLLTFDRPPKTDKPTDDQLTDDELDAVCRVVVFIDESFMGASMTPLDVITSNDTGGLGVLLTKHLRARFGRFFNPRDSSYQRLGTQAMAMAFPWISTEWANVFRSFRTRPPLAVEAGAGSAAGPNERDDDEEEVVSDLSD